MKSADIIKAIVKHHGNLSAAAQALKCARITIYRRAEREPAVQAAIDETRELMLDAAEHVLHRKVLQGSTTELIFFLKTQGHKRGYVERVEHEHRWSTDEIDAMSRGRT